MYLSQALGIPERILSNSTGPNIPRSGRAGRMVHLPLRHIPDTDALVLRVAEDEFLAGVKNGARDVVVMSAAGVYLPSFRL